MLWCLDQAHRFVMKQPASCATGKLLCGTKSASKRAMNSGGSGSRRIIECIIYVAGLRVPILAVTGCSTHGQRPSSSTQIRGPGKSLPIARTLVRVRIGSSSLYVVIKTSTRGNRTSSASQARFAVACSTNGAAIFGAGRELRYRYDQLLTARVERYGKVVLEPSLTNPAWIVPAGSGDPEPYRIAETLGHGNPQSGTNFLLIFRLRRLTIYEVCARG
jgi:hypothetical protein